MRLKKTTHAILVAVLLAAFSTCPLFANDPPDVAKMTAAELGEMLRRAPDDATEITVLRRLEILGLDAVEALPALVDYLKDPKCKYPGYALEFIQKMGPDAAGAIGVAAGFLDRSDKRDIVVDFGPISDPGYDAAVALGKIGAEAIPAVRCRLRDENPIVRMNAATALGAMGEAAKPALSELISLVDDKESFVRRDAIFALPSVAPEDPAVRRALIVVLSRDDDVVIRASAVNSLRKLPLRDKECVRALIERLATDEPLVQAYSAKALGRAEVDVEAAVVALRKGLASKAGFNDGGFMSPISSECAKALGNLGPAAVSALPDVIAAVHDRRFFQDAISETRDRVTTREALIAAVKIAPDDPRTIRMVTSCLDDYRRPLAAQALARIGKPAKAAVPTLKKLLEECEDRDLGSRLWLSTALLRIDPSMKGIDYEKRLLAAFDAARMEHESFDSDNTSHLFSDPWSLIVATLGEQSRDTEGIARHIVKRYREAQEAASEWDEGDSESSDPGAESPPKPAILDDLDPFFISSVMPCFGKKAEPAVPLLIDCLHEPVWHEDVIPALRKITDGDHPLIVKALEDSNPLVRAGTVAVLGANAKAVPLLAKALDDPSARVRLAAVKSLAELLRRGVAEAKGPLERAVKDKRKSIRVVAEGALEKEE